MSEPTGMQQPAPTPLWLKVAAAAGVVVFLVILFRAGVAENKSAVERTSSTIGTITSIKHGYDDKDKYYYCIVSFEDTDHRTFEARSDRVYQKKDPKWKVGDTVRVVYEPSNPKNNKVYVE